MTRKELLTIGSKLNINCGGTGGVPGPCKTASDHATKSSQYRKQAKSESDPAKRSQLTKLADHHLNLANKLESQALAKKRMRGL